MKNLKTIGILVFLSVVLCAKSQNPTINQMNRSIKAINRVQQMMGLKDEPESKIIDQQPVTDIDGNVYQTVKIGNQVWMAENLKVTHYRNGESIANVTDSTMWVGLSTGALCEYNNNHSNGENFGKLYNFYAVSDIRGLAPKGWHVASDLDWKLLRINLKKSEIENDGETWTEINDESNKMNLKLNVGVRTQENFYNNDNTISRYWTTDEITPGNGAIRWEYLYAQGRIITTRGRWSENNKINGFSVRCVKNADVAKKPTTSKTKRKK